LAGSGRLRTGLLGKGATGGLFNFTGGELSADLIAFDLVNEGGVLTPGDGIGQTHIVGDLTMLSGSIRLELAGSAPTAHDALVIGGDFSAGGTLEVLLADSYQPAAGDSFRLFDFSAAAGAFSLDLPTLEEDLVWDASDLLTTGWLSVASASATLSGDFNADGAVDSLDLAIWQNTFGSDPPNQSPSGDADADADVDGADFLAWQRNLSPIFSSAHAPVPEPHVFWLAMATSLLYVVGFRRAA
jgi:hypothetical protein